MSSRPRCPEHPDYDVDVMYGKWPASVWGMYACAACHRPLGPAMGQPHAPRRSTPSNQTDRVRDDFWIAQQVDLSKVKIVRRGPRRRIGLP